MLKQMQQINPSIKTSSRFYSTIHSIDAFSFHYSISHNDRDTTVLNVCLVAYKRGYVLTYNCISNFYRRFKHLADTMIQSFLIQPTEEDLVSFSFSSYIIHSILILSLMLILYLFNGLNILSIVVNFSFLLIGILKLYIIEFMIKNRKRIIFFKVLVLHMKILSFQ